MKAVSQGKRAVRVIIPPRERKNGFVDFQDQIPNQLTVPERVKLCRCGISGECKNSRNVKLHGGYGGEVAYLRRGVGFIVVKDEDNRG
jgi:hypothetical protein